MLTTDATRAGKTAECMETAVCFCSWATSKFLKALADFLKHYLSQSGYDEGTVVVLF
jgi:hypothetical protein